MHPRGQTLAGPTWVLGLGPASDASTPNTTRWVHWIKSAPEISKQDVKMPQQGERKDQGKADTVSLAMQQLMPLEKACLLLIYAWMLLVVPREGNLWPLLVAQVCMHTQKSEWQTAIVLPLKRISVFSHTKVSTVLFFKGFSKSEGVYGRKRGIKVIYSKIYSCKKRHCFSCHCIFNNY